MAAQQTLMLLLYTGSVNFGNMAIAGKTGTTSDYKDVCFQLLHDYLGLIR